MLWGLSWFEGWVSIFCSFRMLTNSSTIWMPAEGRVGVASLLADMEFSCFCLRPVGLHSSLQNVRVPSLSASQSNGNVVCPSGTSSSSSPVYPTKQRSRLKLQFLWDNWIYKDYQWTLSLQRSRVRPSRVNSIWLLGVRWKVPNTRLIPNFIRTFNQFRIR